MATTRRPSSADIVAAANDFVRADILRTALSAHKAANKDKLSNKEKIVVSELLSGADDTAKYCELWAKQKDVAKQFKLEVDLIRLLPEPVLLSTSENVK